MKKTQDKPADAAELRRRAEARLKEKRGSRGAGEEVQWTAEETQRLVQELQIHQIEMEMQNEELRQSRAAMEVGLALYADLYDFAPLGYFTLDRDGMIRRVNLTGARLLGLERERLAGGRFGFFVSEADRPAFNAFLKKVFASRGKETCEAALRKEEKCPSSPGRSGDRRFGETGQLIVHIEAIASENGQECRAAMADITERKRAEEAIRSSEQRLSDIIEFLPDATLVIDKGGKVIAWNRAITAMTGVKAEDMLGKGDYEYALPFYGERRPILIDLALHPQPEREESYTHIQRMGDILFGEAYTPGLPGGKTHLSATASVLRDAGGEVIAAIECIRDDTERRKAQEDLRQAEERYRSIFENAQEGIFRTTPEGSIIIANPAMANIFGYDTPEEMINSINDVAHQLYVDPEERAKIQDLIEKHGFVRNYETQLYRKDGSIIWISMTMHAVPDEKGQILYYEGMDEDITERKVTVERMRKSLGATVHAIAITVETRDPYTAGHQRRVADLARAIATEMNLPADQIEGIRTAAIIHDLGKISVPAEILSKPAKLSDIEFRLIKTHAQAGYDILKDIDFPWPVAEVILQHHERMNGSGYPNGLTGEHLLIESRILAVADVVEAISSHRPYRPARGIDAALDEISKNNGDLFDPEVVDACLKLFHEKGYKMEG